MTDAKISNGTDPRQGFRNTSIAPEDYLKFRQVQLLAHRKSLEAQLALNAVETFQATLEGKYGMPLGLSNETFIGTPPINKTIPQTTPVTETPER